VNDLTFLYDDSDIFAVYKPPGVHSVRLPEGGGVSVADALARHDPTLINASPQPGDCGLIQRLDLETSGVLLGAKNRVTWELLFKSLLQGDIKKTYVALVEGEPRERITFSSYIGTPHRGARKVKVYEKEPAKSARALLGTTIFTPIGRACPRGNTFVTAHASPARRHQVRAHAAYLKHPLVGDSLYGATTSLDELATKPRQFFLHAWQVEFIHPTTGIEVVVQSDYECELSI
jgi:23S rRNA pseudouridine1911/1915/1917 synthase